MMNWRPLAIAAALGASFAMPVFAADGDALQSQENTHGSTVERNPVTTPESQATRVPSWHGATRIDTSNLPAYGAYDNRTVTSPSMGTPSAAQESRATGHVDANTAAPPRTGADVQPGDMGPANAKAGGTQ